MRKLTKTVKFNLGRVFAEPDTAAFAYLAGIV